MNCNGESPVQELGISAAFHSIEFPPVVTKSPNFHCCYKGWTYLDDIKHCIHIYL